MHGLACILSKAQTIMVSLERPRRLTRFRRGAFCQESPQHPSQATGKTFGVQVSDAETPPRPVLGARPWARAPPVEAAPGPPAAWASLALRQARVPLLLGSGSPAYWVSGGAGPGAAAGTSAAGEPRPPSSAPPLGPRHHRKKARPPAANRVPGARPAPRGVRSRGPKLHEGRGGGFRAQRPRLLPRCAGKRAGLLARPSGPPFTALPTGHSNPDGDS